MLEIVFFFIAIVINGFSILTLTLLKLYYSLNYMKPTKTIDYR